MRRVTVLDSEVILVPRQLSHTPKVQTGSQSHGGGSGEERECSPPGRNFRDIKFFWLGEFRLLTPGHSVATKREKSGGRGRKKKD